MSHENHFATPAEALAGHLRQADISASALARKMGVPPNRVTRVLNERTAVTAETALLLEKQFEEPAEYWLALQCRYALAQARSRAATTTPRHQTPPPAPTAEA